MVTPKKSSAKLATNSGFRPEDFNKFKNGEGSDKNFRFWALLEVSEVAREIYMEDEKLQGEKSKKERIGSRAVEGKATSLNEESMRSASEAIWKRMGKRRYGEDPERELEAPVYTEVEDVKELGFGGMWLSSCSSRKKQRYSEKADEEAIKCWKKDDDPEYNLERRTCFESEKDEGLGFAIMSSRKKWSCREKSDKKVNQKCSMKDDDPEWDSERCACSIMENAKGSGFAGMSASFPSSSSSSRKKGQKPRKKSNNNANKKCDKNSEDRPDMCRELKDHINRVLGGKEVRLVIQKRLTQSDVNAGLCRVTIPMNQIIDSEFLRDDEKELLDKSVDKDVRVLFCPSPEEKIGDEKVLKLKLWVMHKKPKGQRAAGGEERESPETHAGGEDDTCSEEEAKSLKKGRSGGMDGVEGPRPSRMYILRSGWTQFVKDNELEHDNLIQIWSFRVDSDLARDELRLALIRLPGNKQGGLRKLAD